MINKKKVICDVSLPHLPRYGDTLDTWDSRQVLLVSDRHGVSHHPPVKAHSSKGHDRCVPIVDMDRNINL